MTLDGDHLKSRSVATRILSITFMFLLLIAPAVLIFPALGFPQSGVANDVRHDTPGQVIKQGQTVHIDVDLALVNVTAAEHFERVVCGNHGITFREQAEIWLEQMKNRKRKPVAPSTLSTWESCLENWLNPNIGYMPLDNVKNLSLKNLGIKMVEGGLGESAIRSYTNVVKMVVASAVNEEGEELYPRKWNHSFIETSRELVIQSNRLLQARWLQELLPMRRKRNTDFSSLSAAVRGCDLGRHLGLESKISLRTVPLLRSCKKRGGHSFTIFSRPKAVLEKLICAQRLQRC